MRKIIVILLMTGLAASVTAESFSKVGTAGAQFLKIGVGSRYHAMGGAAAATASDVYAMFWNPAGLTEVESSALGFTNVNWVLDINLNYIAYAKRFEDVGVFGASVTVLGMGDQEITTYEQEDGTGTFYSASSYAVGLSFARRLTARFSFGATIKYLTEKIHLENASGWAFDFGTQLYPGISNLRLGMSISNMGSDMQFTGPDLDVLYNDGPTSGSESAVPATRKTSPYDLPLLFRMGASYDFEFGTATVLTMAGELQHPNDHDQQGALGAELGWNDQYFLRGGYKINYDEQAISVGAGLATDITKGSQLVIDYSWQDLGRLQSSQRFSVGFTFY